MVAVSYLAVSSHDWDFGFGYLLSGRFTAIYDILVLVLVFALGFAISQRSSCCKKMDRPYGELRINSFDDSVDGFCSESDFEGVCSSKIRPRWCGCSKNMKDSKMSVKTSKTTEERRGSERSDWDLQQTEDSVFMDCRNGNFFDTLLAAKKWAKLGSGFCAGNDVVGVYCSKILFFAISFWRSIKRQILLPVENLSDDAKLDGGAEESGCQQKEKGLMDFRNIISSSTFKTREEEEREEEVFEDCETGDFAELEQESQNVANLEYGKDRVAAAFADDGMDYRKENGRGTLLLRKFMRTKEEEESDDKDGEEEFKGKEIEEYEGEDLMGLNNAYRIKQECCTGGGRGGGQEEEEEEEEEEDNDNYEEEKYRQKDIEGCEGEDLTGLKNTYAIEKECCTEEEEDDTNDNVGDEEEDEGKEIGYKGEDLTGLKNAYKIERSRQNVACLELEEERKAAASAANEAMAMIQRLQIEKNLIEMEARQYRCIAEYNQLYDQQVIQSLLWIISKLELERGVLQNQLKRCRKRLPQVALFEEIVGEAEENQDEQTTGDLVLGNQ